MQVERRIEKVSSTRLVIDLPASFVDRSVEVLILTLDEPSEAEPTEREIAPNGARFAAIARELARQGIGERFGDPVSWQRQERADRPLPGRE